MPENVTNDELFRLLCAIKEEHGEALGEIRKQTTITNGRMIAAETRLTGHDNEIRDLKRSGMGRHHQRRSEDKPDAVTLNIPITKTSMTMLFTVAGGIIAAALTAVAKLLGVM